MYGSVGLVVSYSTVSWYLYGKLYLVPQVWHGLTVPVLVGVEVPQVLLAVNLSAALRLQVEGTPPRI